MKSWETDPGLAEQSVYMRDFSEIWQAADKLVFSRSLQAVSTSRTRIVRQFDPAEIDRMKASAESDLSIGGPGLAGEAFQAGLVDECHLFLAPIAVGTGKKALPDNLQLKLELRGERYFGSGMVYLKYRIIR